MSGKLIVKIIMFLGGLCVFLVLIGTVKCMLDRRGR
jgi:TM2 domain-containing membrane protein YozV